MFRAGEFGGVNGFVSLFFLYDLAVCLRCVRRLLRLLRRFEKDTADSVAFLDRQLQSFGYTASVVASEDYAVNDYVDVVLVVFGEHDVAIVEARHGAVDAHADIAVAAQAVKDRPVLALASLYHRGKDRHPGALFMRLYILYDAVYVLAGYLAPAYRAVRDTYPRIEQPQIVVDLRYGTYRRPRVLVCRLLVDADGRRQTLYGLHVRLLHQAQKLPRVR